MLIRSTFLQRTSSWMIRKLTRIRTHWFKNFFIAQFAKIYQINWDESDLKKPQDFRDFNDFFTRKLKEGCRPIDSAAIVVSPADGTIAAFGALIETNFIKAKGHYFDLASLLADPNLAQKFANGNFVTIYLSPSNYHRIHMPIDGKLLHTAHIPGKLYSVSTKATEKIPTLFADNERLVATFSTEIGDISVIFVGAINVSSIETVWEGLMTPPYANHPVFTDLRHKNITLKKGDEIGRFNMGSTIILVTEKNSLHFSETIHPSSKIKYGCALMHDATTSKSE